jgi:hypothetical protein
MRVIPYGDQYDPEYRRLRYARYADDFVLGAICSKSEAEAIYGNIKDFGHPFNAGHPAPSMTCRDGLTVLPGHGQLIDLR